MTHTAYIALGANLAAPEQALRRALEALAVLPDTQLVRSSSFYQTAPVGLAGQPDFVNAVAELRTGLSPETLLNALFAIEEKEGRIRQQKNGPRTLDLDLLLYDSVECETQHLTLPHPRLHLRAFVIVPLLEIAPECRIPRRGQAAAWLPAVAPQRIARLS